MKIAEHIFPGLGDPLLIWRAPILRSSTPTKRWALIASLTVVIHIVLITLSREGYVDGILKALVGMAVIFLVFPYLIFLRLLLRSSEEEVMFFSSGITVIGEEGSFKPSYEDIERVEFKNDDGLLCSIVIICKDGFRRVILCPESLNSKSLVEILEQQGIPFINREIRDCQQELSPDNPET